MQNSYSGINFLSRIFQPLVMKPFYFGSLKKELQHDGIFSHHI